MISARSEQIILQTPSSISMSLTAELSWAAEWGWRLDYDQVTISGYATAGPWLPEVGVGWIAHWRGDHDPALSNGHALRKKQHTMLSFRRPSPLLAISDRVRVTIHVTRVSDMKSMQLAVAGDVMNLHDLMNGWDERDQIRRGALPRRPQIFGDTGSNFDSQPAVEMAFAPMTMEVRLHFIEQPHHDLDVAEPLMTLASSSVTWRGKQIGDAWTVC